MHKITNYPVENYKKLVNYYFSIDKVPIIHEDFSKKNMFVTNITKEESGTGDEVENIKITIELAVKPLDN